MSLLPWHANLWPEIGDHPHAMKRTCWPRAPVRPAPLRSSLSPAAGIATAMSGSSSKHRGGKGQCCKSPWKL